MGASIEVEDVPCTMLPDVEVSDIEEAAMAATTDELLDRPPRHFPLLRGPAPDQRVTTASRDRGRCGRGVLAWPVPRGELRHVPCVRISVSP
jgi:hypothetical protein